MPTLDIDLHKEVVQRLHARGVTLAQISREVDCSRALVTFTSQGKCKSLRVEEAIAGHLGCEPSEIWPERYRKTEAIMTG